MVYVHQELLTYNNLKHANQFVTQMNNGMDQPVFVNKTFLKLMEFVLNVQMVRASSHQVKNVKHVVLMNKLLTPYVYVKQDFF